MDDLTNVAAEAVAGFCLRFRVQRPLQMARPRAMCLRAISRAAKHRKHPAYRRVQDQL
jgi:hypothetical protein